MTLTNKQRLRLRYIETILKSAKEALVTFSREEDLFDLYDTEDYSPEIDPHLFKQGTAFFLVSSKGYAKEKNIEYENQS